MSEQVIHPISPVFDQHSRVLILGTMPSPKSREQGFFYAHPGNRFWLVLSRVLGEPFPETTQQRRELVLRRRIALWDVLHSCDIIGAQDAKITNPIPNDFSGILSQANIRAVFTTGKKAWQLYGRFCLAQTGMPAASLPSTSGANASASLERLVQEYSAILPYLEE